MVRLPYAHDYRIIKQANYEPLRERKEADQNQVITTDRDSKKQIINNEASTVRIQIEKPSYEYTRPLNSVGYLHQSRRQSNAST